MAHEEYDPQVFGLRGRAETFYLDVQPESDERPFYVTRPFPLASSDELPEDEMDDLHWMVQQRVKELGLDQPSFLDRLRLAAQEAQEFLDEHGEPEVERPDHYEWSDEEDDLYRDIRELYR